jgi:negative regulator of flagellin synthesis FlgM
MMELQAKRAGRGTAMKINLWNTPLPEDAGSIRSTRSRTSSKTANPVTSSRDDKARLSSDRLRVETLQAELQKLPDVPNGKVEALRAAVADGSYERDALQVASAMIDEMAARGRGTR